MRSFRLEALKDDPQVIIETWIKKADDISESRESFEECVGGEYARNTKSSPQKEVGLSSVLFFFTVFEGVCFELSQAWAPK